MNPLKGVLINGYYYGYVSDSFKEQVKLKNEMYETQGVTRGFSALGKSKETFSISLSLDSVYYTRLGDAVSAGTTTWVGVSRLQYLKDIIGAEGVSLPLTFVTPYGNTYSCVPIGVLDINAFNPENPNATTGMEFRVSLTLEVQ